MAVRHRGVWVILARLAQELGDALSAARKKGEMKGIVLDLRNNPGGLLDQSVEVADLFLKDGVIVFMRGRDASSERTFKAHPQAEDVTCPMVVLVNSGSASASEIVAGALRDQKRALILGERTFGKGSVQNLIPLADGTGLKLTVARYYTPSGKSIQAEGISPDFEVAWEAPREDTGPSFSLREKDLRGHLEQKDGEKEEKQEEKVGDAEDVGAMLDRDNQLRLALQFVRTLPVVKALQN